MLPWKRVAFIARSILQDVSERGMEIAYSPGGSIVIIGLIENQWMNVKPIVAHITEKDLLEMAHLKHTRQTLSCFRHCVFSAH